MQTTKKTTIYDIAKACNVSIATVSRVLSNVDYPVKKETEELIRKTAKSMNYTPNLLGRNLKHHNSKDIGVIVPNMSNNYYTTLLQGIYDYAIHHDYNIILCNSYRDIKYEDKNINLLMQKQVAGIVIVSINKDAASIQKALAYGCKVVAVEQSIDAACSNVRFNFRKGGYLSTKHLIDCGHTEIGFVGAPLDRDSRIQMLDGYKSCLEDHKIKVNTKYICLDCIESEGSEVYEFKNGRAAVKRFLAMDKFPTAYVTLNDMTALGVIREFSKQGLRVPEDVSVIGFDNIPFCEVSSPELTTIDQCSYDMGTIAIKTLIDEVEKKSRTNISVTLEPTLIKRKTVKDITK